MVNNDQSDTRSPNSAESLQLAAMQSDQPTATYEYYDAGNHWCKDCNTICGTMFDFFTHMHNKKHAQVGVLPLVASTLTSFPMSFYVHICTAKLENEIFSWAGDPI